MSSKKNAPTNGAVLVAAGILLSRVSGLIRLRVLAHFLGNSPAGDAFYAALKIPNFPQNLFGEGVLSASFIPVYANLVAKGDQKTAGQVAGAIFGFLSLLMAIFVAIGIVATPYLIDLIAPGFEGETRALTIRLVQIIFPGTGLLVLSAWCLGILNSHHKFFLSYAAPVLWNGAIVAVILAFSKGANQEQIAVYASWGLLLGSTLQFAIQLPTTLKLVPLLKISLSRKLSEVRDVIRNFVPVVIGRGVVQFSAYVDNILASFLPAGAVSALGYAQSIYMLPISLFGMSISAAELPAMARSYGDANLHEVLRGRIDAALRRIAFLVIPSVVGFVLLGDVITALLYQSGNFDAATTRYVRAVLAGSSVGLVAATLGRVYSSAFYSIRDTRTPLRFSILRVILTTGLGYLLGIRLPHWLGIDSTWGTTGIAIASGIAAWVEFLLLSRKLNSVIGHTGIPFVSLGKLWLPAIVCGGLGVSLKPFLSPAHPIVNGVLVISLFAITYGLLTSALGVSESRRWLNLILHKLRIKK